MEGNERKEQVNKMDQKGTKIIIFSNMKQSKKKGKPNEINENKN